MGMEGYIYFIHLKDFFIFYIIFNPLLYWEDSWLYYSFHA